MSSRYNAEDIEVLYGLDPVRRRPGMYTDTSRPNHLAQEVIDNAEPLTEEEVAEKNELLKQGFEDWSRRDFQQFVRALETYGW